jgi:Zn-dependent protease with chaperone function
VPGPADREHFFAAQARNRRATWRLTALCLLGVALMGIPMSAVVTPLVYVGVVLLTDLVNLVVPTLNPLAFIPDAVAHADQIPGPVGGSNLVAAVVIAIALIGPGALAMVLTWLGTRALFMRAGPEAIVRALGGRAPRPGDFEEHQLGNVVAEMAIAAGVKPPRVMLLDGGVANAAALGTSRDDAVVLVSRRLLDELDRDETQGVVGHLIGAIGNGDLRVALSTLSLFRAIALMLSALGATLGPTARQHLGQLLRLALRRPAAGSPEEQIAQIDELLSKAADLNDGELNRRSTNRKMLLDVLRFPLMMAHLAIWLCRLAFMWFVVAPLLALVWRSRRYLADSSAVQLTRHPDGLARALASLSAKGGVIPGGSWAVPLFIIGPRSGRRGPFGAGGARSGIVGDDVGLLSFDPPMARRMSRLRRQGATVDLAIAPYRISALARACVTLIAVLVGALLMGCALLITWVALIIDMLFLAPLFAVLHGLLRGWLGG